MVSVITPLFRSEGTVVRCVESVAKAARAAQVPVEHVIVFDGPDPSARRKIDAGQANAFVSVRVVEQPHSGIAAARNAGLNVATAPLVTLLDADDEMTVTRLAAARESQGESILIGRQEIVDDRPGMQGDQPSMRIRYETHHLSSMLLPRTWLQGIGGFDTGFRLGDDWDAVVRLREAGYAIDLRDDVFVIRHVGNHNASNDTQRVAADYISAIRRHRRRTASPST